MKLLYDGKYVSDPEVERVFEIISRDHKIYNLYPFYFNGKLVYGYSNNGRPLDKNGNDMISEFRYSKTK